MAEKMMFRLMAGAHIQTDEDGIERLRRATVTREGVVVPTEPFASQLDRRGNPIDLVKLLGDKFQYAGDQQGRVHEPAFQDGTQRRDGESLKDWSARLAHLAEAEARSPAPTNSTGWQPTPDTLESMSVKELIAHAADEEIDLRGKTRKEDIVAVIRQSLQATGHK